MPTEKEKNECIANKGFESLSKDMINIAESRHNPFMQEGKVDVDKYIDFLTGYNDFINHAPKPFRPMRDRIMKL